MHQLVNGTSVSPRLYLLQENGLDYEFLHLTGNELSFDVDLSKLPCGMNGALYLTEMSETGGRSYLNPGGATYGTGYCDAQCYADPFINGVVCPSTILPSSLLLPSKLTSFRPTSPEKAHAATKWISGKQTNMPLP